MIAAKLLSPFRLAQFASPIGVYQWVVQIMLSTQVYARPDQLFSGTHAEPLAWALVSNGGDKMPSAWQVCFANQPA